MRILLPLLLFTGCGGQESGLPQKQWIRKGGTAAAPSPQRSPKRGERVVLPVTEQPKRKKLLTLHEMATLLAGTLKPGPGFPLKAAYSSYAQEIDRIFTTYVLPRTAAITRWSQRHLKGPKAAGRTLLYPFSGPDLLHADAFFPWAREIVMIGLEPGGTLLDLNQASPSTIVSYLKRIKSSIYHVTRLSFFRTKSMKKQLFHTATEKLNGTLPALLLFLARLGYTIEGVEPVELSSSGLLVPRQKDTHLASGHTRQPKKPPSKKAGRSSRRARRQGKSRHSKGHEIKGNRIHYRKKGGERVTLVYLSANLSNWPLRGRSGLSKNHPLWTFLHTLPIGTTYLKSASYLLHKSYFSRMRTLLLKRSLWILQDDSGIPVRFFLGPFKSRFYGRYTGPIKLFARWKQPILLGLYRRRRVSLLPFGVGYSITASRSNLQLAQRLSPEAAKQHRARVRLEVARIKKYQALQKAKERARGEEKSREERGDEPPVEGGEAGDSKRHPVGMGNRPKELSMEAPVSRPQP